MPKQEILDAFSQLEWPEFVAPQQIATFAAITEQLLEVQQHTNLTAITEPRQIALQHFMDSLAAVSGEPALVEARKAADVGSGAGFPLFPLATVFPSCSWTAIESTRKKTDFIQQTALAAGLTNVKILNQRAEEVANSSSRETFHLVAARAVGAISSLCEVGIPLLQKDGMLLLYKTEAALSEWNAAHEIIRHFGGEPHPEYRYRLPDDSQDRLILRVRKVKATPERYPRRSGVVFRRPL